MAARPHSARPRPGLTMAAPLPAAAPRLPAALPAPSSSRSPAPPPRIAPGPAACGQREEPGAGGGTAAGTEAFWGSFGRNLSPRRPQGGLGLWGGRGLLEAGGLQLRHRSKASGFGLLMKYFPSLSAVLPKLYRCFYMQKYRTWPFPRRKVQAAKKFPKHYDMGRGALCQQIL